MTDITDRPHSNTILYWLSGFIVVGLLAVGGQYVYWKLAENSGSKAGHSVAVRSANNQLSSAIYRYEQWLMVLPARKMTFDHNLTKTGLYRIADVLSALPDSTASETQFQVHAEVMSIRHLADSLTFNWKSGRHADMIKKAFYITADVVDTQRANKLQTGISSTAALRAKIDVMDEKTLTLNQKGTVRDVFAEVGTLFRNIAQ
ncbi:hypothetical protein HH214_05815 [Mucilaginibacter robiniae]|uniref:Uncharacterized protein n=1 Tax=Mucilaginibacter robiniae TaxID=2728022 RepID=A0A7L5DXD8_9SPHI|nr:hypothetical protein [Mucilaginibacter robiniae]QJD95421.1 hypothetical protein HH214_05815 [Mucilaginibacter robiniae]